MRRSRREILTGGTALVTGLGLAGCSGLLGNGQETTDNSGTAGDTGTGTPAAANASGGTTTTSLGAETAVAAEWNAMRARLWDALALGVAGESAAGAAVAGDVFARFEEAGGEYGAHEMLESTSESKYEEFEEALGELRGAGLEAGDLGRAREEATIADGQLAGAQRSLVGDAAANVLDLQLLGITVRNAAALAATDHVDAAGTVAENVLARFEEATVHDALESASSEAYEAFEGNVEGAVSAADAGDAEGVRSSAEAAYQAALNGSYALANEEARAGAGHLATLQARGWDARAIARLGGPSTDYAHAAGLTIYRARVHDARILAAEGQTDRAATMVSDVFAHFEGARAHEALEEASDEAYEGFEAGLSDLQSAIENEDVDGIDAAVETVDENLVAGIESLAGANAPLLEGALFRARFADARERYRRGESAAAAAIARDLFRRFEANELDLHETVESTSEELYHAFEEDHLNGLIQAYENGDDEAVATHHEGVQTTLLEFATAAGTTATVSGAEAAYVAGRGFDAAVLDALGDDARAQAVSQATFEHFEAGAGGYHEAMEAADAEIYEAFEDRLGAIGTAASDGEDVYPVAKKFGAEALASAYAIVASGGGSQGDAAATVMQDTFSHFEEARVHELLEESDHNAYETFERQLEAYVSTLSKGGDVGAAADSYADAAQYAQFAVADSVEELPLSLRLAGTAGGSGESETAGGGDSSLSGGPNVYDGEPGDADHVIDMSAVAFEPADRTISAGDTVAWVHAGGEPHTVTALESDLPSGVTYWASGDFASEEAARTGWENGEGTVASGKYYVHTFETAGTHGYVCIPHEAAGMTGTITVE